MLSLLLVVIGVQVNFASRRRQLFAQTWDSILERVEAIDLAGLRAVADGYLALDKGQARTTPAEIWSMLGGLSGLRKMRTNAEIMLDLAIYAERWNTEDSQIVAAMMRHDAMRFKQATKGMELALLYPFGIAEAKCSLQEAISSYCLMRERLLGLYQVAQGARVHQLQAAL
jgi:hypothetical protein